MAARPDSAFIVKILLASIPISGFGLLWGLFWSVGFKGGSTLELIKYNLSDPANAILAYGPLFIGILLFLASSGYLIQGMVNRARGRSD